MYARVTRPVIGARGLLASGLLSESLGHDLHEEQRDLYEEQMEGRDLQERLTLIHMLIFIKPLSRVGHRATDALGSVYLYSVVVLYPYPLEATSVTILIANDSRVNGSRIP